MIAEVLLGISHNQMENVGNLNGKVRENGFEVGSGYTSF